MIRFGSVILGYREGNVFALPLREFSSNGTYVGSVVRLPTLRVWVSGMGRLPILVVRRMIGFHPLHKKRQKSPTHMRKQRRARWALGAYL